MLRRGEVRANGGRIRPDYRLQPGDDIRIPPVFEQPAGIPDKPPARLVEMIKTCVMYEDERLVVVNKPAGPGRTRRHRERFRSYRTPARVIPAKAGLAF